MIDKEDIYDELISPLMSQVIAICQENDIPVFANFQLSDGDRPQDENPMFCTTSFPTWWQSEIMRDLVLVAYEGYVVMKPRTLAVTITSQKDETER